ncbi:20819_t:CDS:2, partial [Dentiscutata erythropus]
MAANMEICTTYQTAFNKLNKISIEHYLSVWKYVQTHITNKKDIDNWINSETQPETELDENIEPIKEYIKIDKKLEKKIA